MKLSKVSAVVTGAAGGIGTPLCHRLLAAGARLLLVGRDADRLSDLARALTGHQEPIRSPVARREPLSAGGQDATRDRVDVLALDLTSPGSRLAIRDAAYARRVNVLVNGASIPSFGSFESLDDEHVQRVIDTDLVAPIALTRVLLPVLRSAPEASILNIGSALGSIGMPGYTVYAAAKSGMRAFSEALRRELADTSVRVQYLGARATRTAFNDARVAAFNRSTGTRYDPPDKVAAAATNLLESGRAERFIGMPERLLVPLNGLASAWLDRGFRPHRRALAYCDDVAPAVDTSKELE